MNALLEHRKRLKARKPTFTRKDSHKKNRLNKGWRKPKGLQNKLRLQKRGYGQPVKIGWRSPALVRGKSPEGMDIAIVSCDQHIKEIQKGQAIVISSRIGDKKRAALIKTALDKNIEIINFNGKEKLEKINKKFTERKKLKLEKEQIKKSKDKEKEKAAKDKEKLEKETKDLEKKEPTGSEEEIKKKNKQEKDKLLTKKE